MSAIWVWSLLVGLGFIALTLSQNLPIEPQPTPDPRIKAVEVKLLVKLLKEKLEITVEETDPRFYDLDLETVVQISNAVRDGDSATLFRNDRSLGKKISSFFSISYKKLLRFLDKAEEVLNMPPVIICPKNIEVNQEPGVKSAVVTWEEPYATDKEDGVLTSSLELVSDKASGSRFPESNTYVKYRVFDSEGRKDTCWISITVNVIKCPFVWPSEHRTMSCYMPLIYGQSCDFGCEPGYTLEGSSSVSCQETGLYDAGLPTCKAIVCPEPTLPVAAVEWQCIAGNHYNSLCNLICKDGYTAELNDPTLYRQGSMKCLETKQWTTMPHCRDTTPPVVTMCPDAIRVYSDRRTNATEVMWEVAATDNSGEDPVVTQTTGPTPGSTIEEGGHLVRYTFEDSSGNKEHCIFYINVLRRMCPAIPDFHPRLKPDCDLQNQHGSNCTFICSHSIELEGSSFATCEAENDTLYWNYPQGEPTCLEKECVRPPTPPNSQLKCSEVPTGMMCNVECDEGFVTARNAEVAVNMMCPPATGQWTPPTHAGCVNPILPMYMEQKILFYWQAPCTEDQDRSWITEILESTLSKEEFAVCANCVSKQITTECGEARGSIYVLARWRVSVPITSDEGATVAEVNLENIVEKQNSWLYKNFAELGLASTNTYRYKAQEKYGGCPKSTILRGTKCAPCGLGYKYDGMEGCTECPVDTFQDGTDPTRCYLCRFGTFTDGPRTTALSDCRKPCDSGESSVSGLQPCFNCRLNEYQDKQRQTSCHPCKENEITIDTGSSSENDCYVPSEPVTNLQVVSAGHTFIEIEWQHPNETNGILTAYLLGYKVVPGVAPVVEIDLKADATIYNLTNLNPGTRYEIHVTPKVTGNPGSPSTITAATEDDSSTCPPGTSSPTGTDKPIPCIPCQIGFYNDQPGQMHCALCDPGKTTLDSGTILKSDCVETPPTVPPSQCSPGTSSPTGTDTPIPCAPCQIGFYNDQPGQIHCKLCDPGKTTLDVGATLKRDCVDPPTPAPTEAAIDPNACDPGTVSITGLKPHCKTCPLNTRPDNAQTRCDPCPFVNSAYDCSA